MPTKGKTNRPSKEIEAWVKKHLDDPTGMPVRSLAKQAHVSVPGFYNWIKAYKERLLEKSKTGNMSSKDMELAEKRNMMTELEQLKLENRALRDKVVAMMIKHHEL